MDARTAWDNLVHAVSDMQSPGGDHKLKLETVMAGVELLFAHPADEILQQAEAATLPTRAIISWLVFEGGRLPDVNKSTVQALRRLYEATCPPGQGIIPPPASRPLG
jgi:hypothetical protein